MRKAHNSKLKTQNSKLPRQQLKTQNSKFKIASATTQNSKFKIQNSQYGQTYNILRSFR